MEKIDELTRRLAAQEPELKDADALLESIMSRVDKVEQLPALDVTRNHEPIVSQRHETELQKQKEDLWLTLIRWSSSIAALLLLALFISQKMTVENPVSSADYSAVLSAYQPDYSALTQASTTAEAMTIITSEKTNRMGISKLKRQFLSSHQY